MALYTRCLQYLSKKSALAQIDSSADAFSHWLDTPLGCAVLAREQSLLDEELRDLFGYHLLQLSLGQGLKLYESSRICHCVDVQGYSLKTQSDPGKTSAPGLCCDYTQLPFADESVDVTVLHHVLEFSQNPHQVLKEASRVTIPNGHIIIFGLNPISPFGLFAFFARFMSENALWKRKSLMSSRIKDWLEFVDFKTKKSLHGFYNLPINHQTYLDKTQRFEPLMAKFPVLAGEFFCLVARKETAGLTPIKPRWQAPLISGVGMPKRTASVSTAARLSLIRTPKKTDKSC